MKRDADGLPSIFHRVRGAMIGCREAIERYRLRQSKDYLTVDADRAMRFAIPAVADTLSRFELALEKIVIEAKTVADARRLALEAMSDAADRLEKGDPHAVD